MDKKAKSAASNSSKNDQNGTTRRSLIIAEDGIATSRSFAELMSAVMTDLITGAITPQVANATCNAGGKLLKVLELQMKWGNKGKPRNFPLIGP